MKKSLLAICLFVFSMVAYAAEPLVCNGLKIATGPSGKGNSNLFRDIRDISGVEVCEINSTGALQNVDLLAGNKADVAFTTLDILKQRSSDENISTLQVVFPINLQLLHILTRSGGFLVKGEKKYLGLGSEPDKTYYISKVSDLKGKTVALVGSAQAWGSRLSREAGLNFTPIFVDGDKADADAIAMLKKGTVHAVMTALAWSPNGTVGKLRQDSGITLVSYDSVVAPPYVVKNVTYSNLGQYNIPMIGVQNVLVTRPFRGVKSNQVAALKSGISKNLIDLQEGSYEPGWKEIKNIDANVDWAKFTSGSPTRK